MTQEMSGKVALVTGAGSGIGRASARAFAAAGCAVVVVDVARAAGEETAELIVADGGEARFVRADVTLDDDVARMVGAAIESYGTLDYAHNNAGHGGSPTLLADYTRQEWDRLVALNLTAMWACLREEIQVMRDVPGAAIVNTASTFGLVAVEGMAAYVATKHGVVGLTRAAALDYAQSGLRINAICPGATRTPQLEQFWMDVDPDDPEAVGRQYVAREPIGRLGTPEEIAAGAVWLCSPAASFVTGHALALDGGWLAQ